MKKTESGDRLKAVGYSKSEKNNPSGPETMAESLIFTCPVNIEAADDDTQMPKFSMVAYTGGKMAIAGFTHPVIVDLAGLDISRQNLPIRLDHQSRQGVGHTKQVVIEAGQVLADGFISRDTSWARDVANSGSRGFPWQASIGASILEAEFIPQGSQVQVNDKTFDGPVYVVRKAILKEISFVDSGADTNTKVNIAAKEQSSDLSGQSSVLSLQSSAVSLQSSVFSPQKRRLICKRKIYA